MIIYTAENGLKVYEMRSDAPSHDFTGGKAEYVIDETFAPNHKFVEDIKKFAPFFQVVEDEYGNIEEIVDDEEARAEWEANQPKPKQPAPDAEEILNIILGV